MSQECIFTTLWITVARILASIGKREILFLGGKSRGIFWWGKSGRDFWEIHVFVFVVRGSIQYCLRKKLISKRHKLHFLSISINSRRKFVLFSIFLQGMKKWVLHTRNFWTLLVGYSYEITSNTKNFATQYIVQ